MNTPFNGLPNPLEDSDIGYDDAEEMAEMHKTPLQAQCIIATLQEAANDRKRAQQSECSHGPDTDDDFGEVSDPDEDTYADPDDFLGSEGNPV